MLLIFSPIRLYFGHFCKNAGNVEKDELIHQTQDEKVMCNDICAGKFMFPIIDVFYNVDFEIKKMKSLVSLNIYLSTKN